MSALRVRKACTADLNTLEHNEARRLRRANKPVAPSTTTSSSTTSELMLCGQVSTPPAVIGGRRAWPASTPASPASGAVLPRAVLRLRTASRELHDLEAFEHDELRRVRSKAILLERLSATDHGLGSRQARPVPPDPCSRPTPPVRLPPAIYDFYLYSDNTVNEPPLETAPILQPPRLLLDYGLQPNQPPRAHPILPLRAIVPSGSIDPAPKCAAASWLLLAPACCTASI